ncbi:MAG: hypothetical protein K6L80_15010 [Agarilytica sp.]
MRLSLFLVAACLAITVALAGYMIGRNSASHTISAVPISSPSESNVSFSSDSSTGGLAQSVDIPSLDPANGYLARILLNSPDDLKGALLRAEELYRRGDVSAADEPLAFVLHGPEVQIFIKGNYQQYKSIVDLAAKLSAFNVVDVKVCQTRLGLLGETSDALPPFIETVPFGPAEVQRLLVDEQYVYF